MRTFDEVLPLLNDEERILIANIRDMYDMTVEQAQQLTVYVFEGREDEWYQEQYQLWLMTSPARTERGWQVRQKQVYIPGVRTWGKKVWEAFINLPATSPTQDRQG